VRAHGVVEDRATRRHRDQRYAEILERRGDGVRGGRADAADDGEGAIFKNQLLYERDRLRGFVAVVVADEAQLFSVNPAGAFGPL
jgi:hypothetical protein